MNCTLHHSDTENARLEFKMLETLPTGTATLTLTINRGGGLAAPRRGFTTNDPILASGDSPAFEFGGAPATHAFAGLSDTAWAWSASTGNQTTSVGLTFASIGPLRKGDALRLRLPRFKRNGNLAFDSTTTAFAMDWDGEYLELYAKEEISSLDGVGVEGFRAPANGISSTKNFTLSRGAARDSRAALDEARAFRGLVAPTPRGGRDAAAMKLR